MPKYPIDLGKKGPEVACCSPAQSSEPEMYYPSIYLEGAKDYNLPDEGVMTVRFRKTRESTETNHRNEKETHCVNIDIVEIVSVKGDSHHKEESGSDALDKLKKEVEGE